MEYMRGSVRLRAYGQRDPLVEYKREGLNLFKNLEADIHGQILHLLPNIGGVSFAGEQPKGEAIHESILDPKAVPTDAGAHTRNLAPAKEKPLGANGEELGRNDPCFCGSGKKYKKCHGQ